MTENCGVRKLYYKDAIEQCHSFNSRLMAERRVRLPYLDSQTGVAQNNCNLLFERWQRGPGLGINQVFTYPSKRWKKMPRSTPLFDTPFNPTTNVQSKTANGLLGPVESHILNENSNSSSTQPLEYEAISDIPDAGADAYADNDEDYYDEDSRNKKRGRKSRGRGGRTSMTRRSDRDEEREKPHQCVYCGKRYKNKPGLNSHVQRYHQDEVDADDDYNPRTRTTTPSLIDQDSNQGTSAKSALPSSRSGSMAGSNMSDEPEEEERPTRGRKRKQAVTSEYCDFCLGDADENKKTGEPEALVSCADCGRSGHPTCLQFTDIMTINVRKYKWQCIECKSCHLCGTSDNDDQLLFCDDCDRGYHMYCLTPPMAQPPEGSWICTLCEADRKGREAQTS